ncbi:unnamed protein product, partial [Rotaria sp. Silwood1]
PQRSLSSSLISSMYGSHVYEFKQFITSQICDACDELLNSAKSPNEGIRALQRRDCSNVCRQKCRRIGISESSDFQIVVDST